MDVEALVVAMRDTGIFELASQPLVGQGQVTLLGRVRKDPDIAYRWSGFMRNVLLGCGNTAVDFSRAYRVVRYMVQTKVGPKPDTKLIWNWRIVVTDAAIPYLLGECRSITEAAQTKNAMTNALMQFSRTGEGRMPISLPGDPGAAIMPLTSSVYSKPGR